MAPQLRRNPLGREKNSQLNVKTARTLLVLAVLLLLATSWLGLKGGIEQWPQSQSLVQKVQSAAQFVYGILAVVAVASATRTGTFAGVVRVSWLVAITIAGGIAPVAWGGAGWLAGVVAGLAACVVALLVLWLLRAGSRGLTRV